uniref:Uncharacterized protein n=1 Tax=Nicotiana tabacum TaxID=4097 RepID=A0A1S3Y8A5_TOBAC
MGDRYRRTFTTSSRKGLEYLRKLHATTGHSLSAQKSQNSLKKRLEAAKGRWPEELAGVLWAYRIIVKSSTGETLFYFVYGAEALIPVEMGEPTLRYSQANEESNSEAMLINLELLEERRDLAHVRMEAQKQKMERCYSQTTNLRYSKVGNLVLRKQIPTGKLNLLPNKCYTIVLEHKALEDFQ